MADNHLVPCTAGSDPQKRVGGGCPNPLQRHLEELRLRGNWVADWAIPVLADVLPRCPNLTALDLGSNNLRPTSAAALAGRLRDCRALRTLVLANNAIGGPGALALARGRAPPSPT